MNCTEAQELLLAADRIDDLLASNAELAGHVQGCADCQALIRKIKRLETLTAALPVPKEKLVPSATFMAKVRALSELAPTSASGIPPQTLPFKTPGVNSFASANSGGSPIRTGLWMRRSVAAAIVVAVGMSAILLFLNSGGTARGDTLLQDLLSWNLQLAKASPSERVGLFQSRAAAFMTSLSKSSLSTTDREAGQALLDNATYLSTSTDPLADAQHLQATAQQLNTFQKTVSDATSSATLSQIAQTLINQGVAPVLDRINPKILSPVQQQELNTLRQQITPPATDTSHQTVSPTTVGSTFTVHRSVPLAASLDSTTIVSIASSGNGGSSTAAASSSSVASGIPSPNSATSSTNSTSGASVGRGPSRGGWGGSVSGAHSGSAAVVAGQTLIPSQTRSNFGNGSGDPAFSTADGEFASQVGKASRGMDAVSGDATYVPGGGEGTGGMPFSAVDHENDSSYPYCVIAPDGTPASPDDVVSSLGSDPSLGDHAMGDEDGDGRMRAAFRHEDLDAQTLAAYSPPDGDDGMRGPPGMGMPGDGLGAARVALGLLGSRGSFTVGVGLVPEPTSIAAVVAAGGILLLRRRRS